MKKRIKLILAVTLVALAFGFLAILVSKLTNDYVKFILLFGIILIGQYLGSKIGQKISQPIIITILMLVTQNWYTFLSSYLKTVSVSTKQ